MNKDIVYEPKVKRYWKNFVGTENFSSYLSLYRAILVASQSLMTQMIDFLFVEDIQTAFWELAELNSNIDLLLSSDNKETQQLCKDRIDFLIKNKAQNWYI